MCESAVRLREAVRIGSEKRAHLHYPRLALVGVRG